MFEKYIIHDDVSPSQGVCLRFMFYSFYRDLESNYFSTSLKITQRATSI